ncbi:MAG: DUF1549 domain-containing protein, partial [Planctomycetaceae bacterium]|nr:DUF1549 domain-containing protein [Planctomycetaceae bacterium]
IAEGAEYTEHWAFREVVRPDVPQLDADFVRNPIDQFVLAQLQEHGLQPSAPAENTTLIRRVSLDLTGLPPALDQLDAFLADETPDAYERMVDQLLASPHYGERWGRHWLDHARYADTNGYTIDGERSIWPYRDWVIQAFNDDMAFDQFTIEQLAGDLLPAATSSQLIATGFHRNTLVNQEGGTDAEQFRNEAVVDRVNTTGAVWLGLTIGCAQCHSHKYDPISQQDYYQLFAFFNQCRDVNSVSPTLRLPSAEQTEELKKLDADSAELRQELAAVQQELQSEGLADAELAALNAQKASIEERQKALAEERKKVDRSVPVTMIMADVDQPRETHVLIRGDFLRHGDLVQADFPAALNRVGSVEPANKNADAETQRKTRLDLAKWLVDRRNPLTARVLVNRIWARYFGQGLVETENDFGFQGTPPTHPELLDWLAAEFVRSGWSLKQLHRLIMTSTTWRQSAATDNETVMAEGILLARKRLLRLDAETIRDRMLAASGQLDRTLHGPPLPIKEDDTGQVIVDGSQTRRSMYIQWRRSRPVAMLQAFDAPVMETNCELRTQSTVATQSLILLNGEFILAQADRLAARAAAEAVSLPAERLATLPVIPGPLGSDWQYGFGDVDATGGQVASFTKLAHFDGSRWQMGPVLPDPQFGYVFLNATGGHPDAPGRAVIRRWTAPAAGSVMIGGTLSHGSPNGDGVRGRIYSSREGIFGEWTAFNAPAPTGCGPIRVEAGDTLDFVTDCRDHHTSDSFNWPVTLTVQCDDGTKRSIASQTEFRGPPEVDESLPEQIVRAWQLALCREPTDDELQLAVQFAADQILTLHQSGVTLPENRTAHRQALVSLCQSLLGCNEFLYVD